MGVWVGTTNNYPIYKILVKVNFSCVFFVFFSQTIKTCITQPKSTSPCLPLLRIRKRGKKRGAWGRGMGGRYWNLEYQHK
jgi:hypothetical protein